MSIYLFVYWFICSFVYLFTCYSSTREWLEPVLWPRTWLCMSSCENMVTSTLRTWWYVVSTRRLNILSCYRNHNISEQPVSVSPMGNVTLQSGGNGRTTSGYCCSHKKSHNQVRGHRTGSSHSGAEEYPRGKTKKQRWYTHISQLTEFMPPPETYKSEIRSQPTMCQVHTGAYVSLLAPGKTDYSACHPGKTTMYILHVVPITTHTHVRRKSTGKKKQSKERKEEEGKKRKEKKWNESEKVEARIDKKIKVRTRRGSKERKREEEKEKRHTSRP